MPQAYMLVGGIPSKHDPQNYTQITHVLRTYQFACVCVCDSESVCTQITVLCVISASELELFILAL